MTEDFDLHGFLDDLEVTLANGRKAFEGKYKQQLNDLQGLSRAQIDEIVPGIEDLQKYDELITVVKAASAVNLKQAELKAQIEKLGAIGIEIAKRVPTLAAIL